MNAPPALKKDWDDLYNQFVKYYGLDEKQRAGGGQLEGAESEVVRWLTLQVDETTAEGPAA